MDNDDLPDGAWWAVLEDSVTQYNEVNNTNYDPFDSVHEYVSRVSEQQEKERGDAPNV